MDVSEAISLCISGMDSHKQAAGSSVDVRVFQGFEMCGHLLSRVCGPELYR